MLLAHSGRFVTIGLAIVATLGGCAPESGAGEGAVSHAASLEVDQDGYVSTPGARARAECVHEVPNGASVGTEDGDDVVRHNGKIVARYSPCGFPVRSGNVASRSEMQPEPDAVDAVPDGIGKQTFPLITVGRPSWTAWTQTEILSLVGNTRWFSEIDATMVIPATPVSYVSQLLYWFPALCPHDGSSILQPVLQYGPGPSGGGGITGHSRGGTFPALEVCFTLLFNGLGRQEHLFPPMYTPRAAILLACATGISSGFSAGRSTDTRFRARNDIRTLSCMCSKNIMSALVINFPVTM